MPPNQREYGRAYWLRTKGQYTLKRRIDRLRAALQLIAAGDQRGDIHVTIARAALEQDKAS